MTFPERDNKAKVDDIIIDYCRRENIAIDAGYYVVADILQLILDDMRGYNFLVRMSCPPDVRWGDATTLAKRINGKHEHLYKGLFNKNTIEKLLEEYNQPKEEDDSTD